MKKSDILIEIENLSLYFSGLEQQVKDMNQKLEKITELINHLEERFNEKRSDDS